MDNKQKEQLRVFLKARKRADKVLAKRRIAEREKENRDLRLKATQELKKQYNQELTALAQESGILRMAEEAARHCGGLLAQEIGYYLNYGLTGSSFPNMMGVAGHGELRAGFLALKITWEAGGAWKEVEIRVHKKGTVTFHNSFFPVFPIFWRWDDRLLRKMLASALDHPRLVPRPFKRRSE